MLGHQLDRILASLYCTTLFNSAPSQANLIFESSACEHRKKRDRLSALSLLLDAKSSAYALRTYVLLLLLST